MTQSSTIIQTRKDKEYTNQDLRAFIGDTSRTVPGTFEHKEDDEKKVS
jgi:hypothetical protein